MNSMCCDEDISTVVGQIVFNKDGTRSEMPCDKSIVMSRIGCVPSGAFLVALPCHSAYVFSVHLYLALVVWGLAAVCRNWITKTVLPEEY